MYICDPGFTGPFCSVLLILTTVLVLTAERTRDVWMVISTTPVCVSLIGFTGTDCLTNINECVGVFCANSIRQHIHMPIYPPGHEFTGQLCETNADLFQL